MGKLEIIEEIQEYHDSAVQVAEAIKANYPKRLLDIFNSVKDGVKKNKGNEPIPTLVRFTQEEGPDVDFVGSTFQIEGDVGVSIGVEGKQPWGVGKGHSGEIVLIAVKAKIPGEDGLFENQFVLHHFEDHMLAYYADSINKFWTPLNADDGLPEHNGYLVSVLSYVGVMSSASA